MDPLLHLSHILLEEAFHTDKQRRWWGANKGRNRLIPARRRLIKRALKQDPISLGGGYSLYLEDRGRVSKNARGIIDPYTDWWMIRDETDDLVGRILVYRKGKRVGIEDSRIKDEFRGQGLGRKAMRKLVKFYGHLTSDPGGSTSTPAEKAWKAIGGEPMESSPVRDSPKWEAHLTRKPE
jgi:hypothetical protein